MAAKAKLKTFIVVRTPKLRDATGAYCKMGQTCQLTKELAEHYHKLGYIRLKMDDIFDDADDDDTDGADGSADEAQSDSGPDDTEPASASGEDDEGEAGSDAENDAGTGASKVGSRRLSNRRRKRVAG